MTACVQGRPQMVAESSDRRDPGSPHPGGFACELRLGFNEGVEPDKIAPDRRDPRALAAALAAAERDLARLRGELRNLRSEVPPVSALDPREQQAFIESLKRQVVALQAAAPQAAPAPSGFDEAAQRLREIERTRAWRAILRYRAVRATIESIPGRLWRLIVPAPRADLAAPTTERRTGPPHAD